jgi:hypothetical protein
VTARRPEDCEGEHAWRKFAGPGKQLVWRCVVCLTLKPEMRWTRDRAGSGPGDTLNGRFEVRRAAGRWRVFDRRRPSPTLTPGGFATMREARAMAETIAREAEQ